MFFSVIIGYVLSALFAFVGVMQIVDYIKHMDRALGYGPFINGLAVSCIWLGVAVMLVLFIQIATFLEKLVLEGKKQSAADLGPVPMPPRGQEKNRGANADAREASSVPASEQPTMRIAPQTGTAASDADPEAPRVPDLPGSGSGSSSAAPGQQAEEDRGLHYFKM